MTISKLGIKKIYLPLRFQTVHLHGGNKRKHSNKSKNKKKAANKTKINIKLTPTINNPYNKVKKAPS